MSYDNSRAVERLVGDVHREINEYYIGPPRDIFWKNDILYVNINLPGFDKDKEIEYKVIGEKRDRGFFDDSAHVLVKAKRKEIDRKVIDVIVENRPIKYDFKIPLHVPLKEDEVPQQCPASYTNGVLSLKIPHKIPGGTAKIT